MHVADDADHLPPLRVTLVLIGADMRDVFANRVFVREVARGERLVDDGDADAATTALILFGEAATFPQRNLERLEILGGDAAVAGRRLLAGGRRGAALDPEVAAHIA